jgi:hypothetical protein
MILGHHELMLTRKQVVDAAEQLRLRFSSAAERERFQQNHVVPGDSDLIDRTITAADGGTADAQDVKAALTLLSHDQWAADNREANLMVVARNQGISWREIASRMGMSSPQAARQRYERITGRQPRIYAFRVAGDAQAPWHGEPVLLAEGYESAVIDFDPPGHPGSPFAGRMIEVRYGLVPDDGMPGYLRGFPMVGNRRIGMTENAQRAMFGY